jgi:hypothetical protein
MDEKREMVKESLVTSVLSQLILESTEREGLLTSCKSRVKVRGSSAM